MSITIKIIINITEIIGKALDDRNTGCGGFVDLQQAFHTVDDQILLPKLHHYGIRGVSNCWCRSYLSNRNQYLFINGCDSGLAAIYKLCCPSRICSKTSFIFIIFKRP